MSDAHEPLANIGALTFDVFGTVVDWRSSVIGEGQALGRARGLDIDWAAFADAWRGGYAPAMDRVRHGELPWTRLDDLHRMTLDRLLEDFGIAERLDETDKAHLNRVWHRLDPWPDSVAGMQRLRRRFILATLSNGNVSLLVNMAKHAGLSWDCVLSAELAGHYKRDPEVYHKAAELLDLPPSRIMMVAAHQDDLQAAYQEGFRTAFVKRPLEHGPEAEVDLSVDPRFDVVANDFLDLADQLVGPPSDTP
ncbi:haloacid dehalogenase type II [Halomonas urumqiensis]|uniref:(S)-2-haloacid dehalogenase n=1 Tax=Halomonas urumqiensis TaxID=1684789 RepID=A0A2N7UMK3_9GAMM|nr:haloacid dehalogenase type II [Halomonas urumqiensis]PMR81656.1 haloacid dehalogenase type II [Halomonas urumqiensis]PTB02293.1 haloacid dehalogenase type II [Halomonas urumqiensis]GHE21761.1 haloacid dehalogenase [Halomonas urumqiensis]